MARSVTFTFSQVLETLMSIVAEFGADHVGNLESGYGCRYVTVKEGRLTASCIVGQWLDRMGLLGLVFLSEVVYDEDDDLRGQFIIEGSGYGDTGAPEQAGTCTSLIGLLEEFGITFDEDARRLLINAQISQDSGTPWGDAVHSALVTVNGRRLNETERALAAWHTKFLA